jgi:hypothetical protein
MKSSSSSYGFEISVSSFLFETGDILVLACGLTGDDVGGFFDFEEEEEDEGLFVLGDSFEAGDGTLSTCAEDEEEEEDGTDGLVTLIDGNFSLVAFWLATPPRNFSPPASFELRLRVLLADTRAPPSTCCCFV